MNISEKILKMARVNNGIVSNLMIDQAGISRGNLKYLVDCGKLEKSTRGVYKLPEIWDDEFINLQTRFSRGIFSIETALYLNSLSDRTPNYYCMTFPATYNVTQAKHEGIRCTLVTKTFYEIGISTVSSPSGNIVKAYSAERTLCDIVRPRCQIDIQLVTDAFKQYSKKKEKNIPELSEYAKIFKVEDKIRTYLEVLL